MSHQHFDERRYGGRSSGLRNKVEFLVGGVGGNECRSCQVPSIRVHEASSHDEHAPLLIAFQRGR
jgi:hypothetical protein